MIDTHAHLNFEAFQNDYQRVIDRAFKNNVRSIINVGCSFSTSRKALKIAKEHNGCYAAIGLHPTHAKDERFEVNEYAELIKNNIGYIKAIGETGLDFYHSDENKDKQVEVLRQHIELSRTFSLPLILHCRGSKQNPQNAYVELLEVIKEACPVRDEVSDGVIHCFSSNWQIAQEFLNLGLHIGFTGIITFKNVDKELLEVVKNTPLDRILVETDCPYLSPEPHRGERNESAYVMFTAQKIAEIKGISLEEVDKITTTNAKKLFNIV